MDAIFNRTSVRKYKQESLKKEEIDLILKAAFSAPSARNSQPWQFIVVENKDTLKAIGETCPRVTNSQVAIVLIANIERAFYKKHWQQDMSAAAENMLLEACNLNLGGLWNGVAPTDEKMEKIRELFNLNENIKPFCIISLGYPADGLENKFMDKYDETRIHYEKY